MGESGGDPKSEAPPVRGLLGTTWEQREHLPGWDIAIAALLAVAGVLFISTDTLAKVLGGLLIAELGLTSAVLGVVIAGLAIIVAFLSREYAQVLMEAEDGPMGDFWPFWFVAAIAGTAVLAAGAGLVIIEEWPCARREVFGVTTFLSSYAVLATVNLVAFVAHQGVTRAWQMGRKR